MTKLLSQLLVAPQPQFSQTLARLEAASGNSSQDIRLSENLIKSSRQKILELGLDPADTTGEELFLALQEKLRRDDWLLIKRLRQISATSVSAAANLSEGIALSIDQAAKGSKVFVLKTAAAKKLLKQSPPKKTMRLLGYRSLDSLLKHEPLTLIVPAALACEPHLWQYHYESALKLLSPSQFEERKISVFSPHLSKWQPLCSQLLARTKQTVIVNKELGSLLILPLPNRPVAGVATATLALAADGLNAIHAASSYLRLGQVASDFGRRIEIAAADEPSLSRTEYFEAPLSWETVQRFMHHFKSQVDTPIEEYLGVEQLLGWQPVETLINGVAPEMRFWQDSGHLGVLLDNQTVSLNVLDNALSLVNRRCYSEHYSHHFRRSLWQEFIARYIRPELLNKAISQELSPQLQPETAEA